MTRLGFIWARLRQDEAALRQLSEPIDAALADARVALVGNARSLARSRLGPQIDAADIVIRINAAPLPSPHSHGLRTDWLAISTPVPRAILADRAPKRILWITPRRKRLPWRIARTPGFHLHPRAEAEALRTAIGARPTTGLMMIDKLLRSNCAKVDLYGFDFFGSLSLSGSRGPGRVPHDFDAERAWVGAALERDPRLSLHRTRETVSAP